MGICNTKQPTCLGGGLFVYERIMIFAGAVLLTFPGFNSDIWGARAVILVFIFYYLRNKKLVKS